MNDSWAETVARATELRRELHRRPEIAWAEHATAATVRAELDAIGLGWRTCGDTGTVVRLSPSAPGRHVALRADLDAMPIGEATGLPYASATDGVMHACGHDGHTAALLAAARWLHSHESSLPGPVTLLFQPAEEGGHGARGMIADGALDGVEAVFGWHNWPGQPFGRALCPDGPVMSANGTFEVDLFFLDGEPAQVQRGQTLQMKLTLGDPTPALLIPNGAFYNETGGAFVFRIEDTDAARDSEESYSALLDAPGGVVVHVDTDGEYQGSISHALLQNVLEGRVDLRRYD